MSRMKAHWPERLDAIGELKSAIYWLEADLDRADIYRCLAVCEAISILQWCIDACRDESKRRAQKLREEYRKQHESTWNQNPFDEAEGRL